MASEEQQRDDEADRKPVDHSYDNTMHFRQLLSKRERVRDTLATTLLWLLYGYLWLPVISLIAWYHDINFAYDMVQAAGGPEALVLLLLWFGIAFLIILAVVVSWSSFQYNSYRGDRERRTRVSKLDLADERKLWEIDEALQARIKGNKIQTLSLDSNQRIQSVLEGSPPPPVQTETT